MAALVVIPALEEYYSFSAPLGWLFSKNSDQVLGIYGFEVTKELVRSHDLFILELNWFIELREFELLVSCIRRYNPGARILFGGLYSQPKFEEIFQRFEVDYFIEGYNELPMQLFLNGEDPKTIPNMVGRGFQNPTSYVFEEADYEDIEFNLDWFPSYLEYGTSKPLGRRGGRYWFPYLVTSRGGCVSAHGGCEYCMGSRLRVFEDLYHASGRGKRDA